MGIFGDTEEEKQYKNLIKLINENYSNDEIKELLIGYITKIKNGIEINVFYNYDTLYKVLYSLSLLEINDKYSFLEYYEKVVKEFKFILPFGDKTENYNELSNMVINLISNERLFDYFSEDFYSLFDNKLDYFEIMFIIFDKEIDIFLDEIIDFSFKIARELENKDSLKSEILEFIRAIEDYDNEKEINEYASNRINELKMRYGVYPGLDEKNIATLSRKIEKARRLVERFDDIEKQTKAFDVKVNERTTSSIETINETALKLKKELETYSNEAIMKMQKDLSVAKKELMDELNKFLISLEDTMKNNSDKIFNQLLLDARERIEQIRLIASNLSTTTTKELIRIQNQSEESIQKLKEYVENNPELSSSLKVAKDSEEVMNAIIKLNSIKEGERVVEVKTTDGIILPETKFLVPKFEMTTGILDAFDRNKKFSERMNNIEIRINDLKKKGYIIPESLMEALPWYMMGKKIVYFYGPTQSGKTTIADLLVKVVGTEILDGGKISDEYSVTSYNDVRGIFDENALFYSLYYGKTVFYDEIDNGNPDSLIVLGTYASKLVNKIDHPERDIQVQFAKRRFVPINPNARIIAAGNTTGKGRNRQYVSRSRIDESSQERFVPIYVGYSDTVESQLFGKYTEWFQFFKSFRRECINWANASSLDDTEGSVTTGDASTIVECLNEESMDIFTLINGLFIQTKEEDYLGYLMNNIQKEYSINNINEDKVLNYRNDNLKNLNAKQIAESFVYLVNKKISKKLTK